MAPPAKAGGALFTGSLAVLFYIIIKARGLLIVVNPLARDYIACLTLPLARDCIACFKLPTPPLARDYIVCLKLLSVYNAPLQTFRYPLARDCIACLKLLSVCNAPPQIKNQSPHCFY